jgi:hypothetical protein
MFSVISEPQVIDYVVPLCGHLVAVASWAALSAGPEQRPERWFGTTRRTRSFPTAIAEGAG